MAKMRFSPRPTRTRALGWNFNTWRQISEPMLPPAPVDHHGAVRQEMADGGGVQLDGLAPQEVLDVDVADGDPRIAVEAVLEGGDDPQVQIGHWHASIRVRSREPGSEPEITNTSGHAVRFGELADVVERPEDRDLAEAIGGLAVGGHEALDPILQVGAGL